MSHLPATPAPLARRVLAASLVAAFGAVPGGAWAQLPTGAQVVAGTAQVTTNGAGMTVRNSPNAVLNWQSFSIGAENTVRFQQDSAASKVLNRVVGNDPSSILGQLSSNGEVWLVNPHGVLFGANARVDVGGLVASSLGISSESFLGGQRSAFGADGVPGGQILNQGTITSLGGHVWLVGGSVRNEGTVTGDASRIVLAAGQHVGLADSGVNGSPDLSMQGNTPDHQVVNTGTLENDEVTASGSPAGRRVWLAGGAVTNAGQVTSHGIVLAAGQDISLTDSATPNITVTVSAPDNKAINLGTLLANGGSIDVHGAIVNQDGIVNANRAVASDTGRVVIVGENDVELGAHSRTSADTLSEPDAADPGAGSISVVSRTGTASVYGAISATNMVRGGGSVTVQGRDVHIDTEGGIDASGGSGGGTVQLGRGGSDASLGPTLTNYVSASTSIKANATNGGPGGSINIWSQDRTRVYGRLAAISEGVTGTGGTIDMAGYELDARPARLDVAGSESFGGRLTLHAGSFTIQAGSYDATVPLPGNARGAAPLPYQDSTVYGDMIRAALASGANVELQAGGLGARAQTGNIVVAGSFGFGPLQSGASLTFAAHGDIVVNDGVAIGIGDHPTYIPVSLMADVADTGTGRIALGAESSIVTGGGDLTLRVGTGTGTGTQRIDMKNSVLLVPDVGCLLVSAKTIDIVDSDITGGGLVSLQGDAVRVQGGRIGSGISGSGRIDIGASSVSLDGAHLAVVGGPIHVTAQNDIALGTTRPQLGATKLESDVPGDAIVLTGARLSAPSGSLVTPHGRWLAYLGTTPDATSARELNALGYRFVQLAGAGNAPLPEPETGRNGIILRGTRDVYVKVDAGRDYDGTTDASFTRALSTDRDPFLVLTRHLSYPPALGGVDTHAVLPAQGQFSDKNAGTDKPVTVDSEGTLFDVATATGQRVYGANLLYRADITPRGIDASGITAQDKVYDGNRGAALSGALAGVLEGDNVSLAGATGLFADRNAGTDKTVTISGGVLTGLDAANYRLDGGTTAAASIMPRIVSLAALNKEYDGTRTATLSGTLSGKVDGDDVRAAETTAMFVDKDAGVHKMVIIGGATLAGTDAGNYMLSDEANLFADITPRVLDASGLVALNKVYDGTRAATLSGGLSRIVAGDSVGIDAAAGQFADKHAGMAKPVTISDTALTGPDAHNYTMVGIVTRAADITPRPLDVAGLAAHDKVYDGTRAAAVTGSLRNVLPGDAVSLEATGTFDTRDAGTGKNVGIDAVLRGADAADYTLPATFHGSASIAHRPVQIIVTGDVRKEYDATATAVLAPDGFALDDVVADDTLAVRGPAQGSYDSRDSGERKLVSAAGTFTVTGPDARNYRIADVDLTGSSTTVDAVATGYVGTITPATLVYHAAPAAYPSGLSAGLLTGTITGFKGDDNLANATGGTVSWQSPATAGAAPGIYPIVGTGLSARNYVLVQAPGNASALGLIPAVAEAPQQRAQEHSIQQINSATQAAVQLAAVAMPSGALIDHTSPAASKMFGVVQIHAMGQGDLSQMLAERRDFKRKLFADAIYKLTLDPSLADVPACASAAQAASGTCLITLEQVNAIHAAKHEAALVAAAPRPGHAELPQIERKIALLLGINDYADKNIPQLVNSIPDTDSVGQLFADKLGYEVRTLHDPDKAAIIRMLNALAADVGPSDSVVVYYAGHGFSPQKSKTGYWLAADAKVTDPAGWISNRDIARLLANIRARQITLISDSCYSGAFASEGLGAVGHGVTADDVLSKRSVVVLSSGGDEPVADEGKDGHSIFAWALMREVSSVKSWEPGTTVFEKVQAAVRKEFPQTPKYGSLTAAGHQPGGDYLFEFRTKGQPSVGP